MTYNFDEIIDRRHTNALNTDGFRGCMSTRRNTPEMHPRIACVTGEEQAKSRPTGGFFLRTHRRQG